MADFAFGAPTAAPAADAAPVATKASDDTTKAYEAKGKELLSQVSEEELATYGKKTGDFTFLYMLGDPIHRSKRRESTTKDPATGVVTKNDVPCSSPLGFVFRVNADSVDIPVISATKNHRTGCSAADIASKTVHKGDEIILTYLEAFMLGIRPEYSLRFAAEVTGEDGVSKVLDPAGFALNPKFSTLSGEKPAKLPTPSPSLKKTSIKATMVDVCQDKKDANGEIVWVKPEYKEKFECIMKTQPRANSGIAKTQKADNSLSTAAICRSLVADMLGKAQ